MKALDQTRPRQLDTDPRPTAVIDGVASQWAIRRRAGLDEAGERGLAAWLAADPAHEDAYSRMAALSDALQRARSKGASSIIVAHLTVRARKRRARRKAAAAIGGSVVVALIAGLWVRPMLAPLWKTPHALVQSVDPIRRLSDGSIVELNGRAEIAVKYDSRTRRVELLRGEALFRVEKDSERPFIVHAGGVDVRAVGTAFNVRLADATVEILVTEGKVGVDDAARGESLLPKAASEEAPVLVAGQEVVVHVAPRPAAKRSVRVAQVQPAEIKERLSWRIPRLEFDGIELAQAVARMNRENRLQIVVEDDSLKELRVSGAFIADDPHTFARLIAATLGLEIELRSEGEILLRKASVPSER